MKNIKEFKEKIKNTNFMEVTYQGKEFKVYKISKRSLAFISSFKSSVVYRNLELDEFLKGKVVTIKNHQYYLSLICLVVESDLNYKEGEVL